MLRIGPLRRFLRDCKLKYDWNKAILSECKTQLRPPTPPLLQVCDCQVCALQHMIQAGANFLVCVMRVKGTVNTCIVRVLSLHSPCNCVCSEKHGQKTAIQPLAVR